MADDEITARAVKEAAACDETVRHGFTWDNEECGERYRDWQARLGYGTGKVVTQKEEK